MTTPPSPTRLRRVPASGPPVILLDGAAGTAISVARSLGRAGVKVYLLSKPDCPAALSRYTSLLKPKDGSEDESTWARFLLGQESDWLRGAVLLAGSDAAIETIIEYRHQLAARFLLDISDPDAQKRLLGKLSTYQEAIRANVNAPRFWIAPDEAHVLKHRDEYSYPLIVKPLLSHAFAAQFPGKFFVAQDQTELVSAVRKAHAHGLEVMLVEEVPGGDDQLCSYYTYIDESGRPAFDFTKRIIRRYPRQSGLACYHITDCNPEVRDVARRFLAVVGLKGLANVEFKRDQRDGLLKLIECNARFTAANGLLTAAGYDLATFVYDRLVGRPHPPLAGKPYVVGRRLWHAGNDFRAFLQLRSVGELETAAWLRSVMHRQLPYYFRWDDPAPAAIMTWRASLRGLARCREIAPGSGRN